MPDELAQAAAYLASLADETPEGRSVVVLARDKLMAQSASPIARASAEVIPFTASDPAVGGAQFGSIC